MTVLISRAPPVQTRRAGAAQVHCAAAPVWITQQLPRPRGVQAEAQRLVARDRFGADELDVGGQRGRRAVEAARLDEADQAGRCVPRRSR